MLEFTLFYIALSILFSIVLFITDKKGGVYSPFICYLFVFLFWPIALAVAFYIVVDSL